VQEIALIHHSITDNSSGPDPMHRLSSVMQQNRTEVKVNAETFPTTLSLQRKIVKQNQTLDKEKEEKLGNKLAGLKK